jgi:hydroxymethylglutaryl-CoA reductase (NADPH)
MEREASRPGPAPGGAPAEPGAAPALARIPRDAADDHCAAAVERRLALCEATVGRPLEHLRGRPVPPGEARGKVENLVGFAQVPLGIAGPLAVDGEEAGYEVYVPLATTEGAMVAAYSRGMRLLREAGGARARVLREGLSQCPVLVYDSAAQAARAAELARGALAGLAARVAETTRHGRLVALEPSVIGRRLLLALRFETGDAIGINMAARAADLCAAELERMTGARARYVHGQDVEKRAHARGLLEGRGRWVVCEARVPRPLLAEHLRTTPEALREIWATYAVGFAQLGTQGWTVQAANGLAALFLACGQDVAYVTESANGRLELEVDEQGDLWAALTLPSLLVGTVGGGSGQGTARECLELLGCAGAGRARRFAEIAAATVLAGDLSLLASFCTHEFVPAHERLGRNRPGGAEAER